MTTDETPADAIVDILKRELPGFAAEFHAATDRFRVRGPIHFNATVGFDIVYAVPDHPEAIERVAAALVTNTRRHAIEALGLETLIREELQRARHEAAVAAFADGKAKGKAEGRRELLAELAAAIDEREADDE